MSADAILARLDKVKPTGPGRGIACCPAHGDKSPSLSIREADDRTLIYCFAGCERGAILAAVGLTWAALYPPRNPHSNHYRKAAPVSYADALRCIGAECFVVLTAAGNLERGHCLNDNDMHRVSLAVARIATACNVTGAWR